MGNWLQVTLHARRAKSFPETVVLGWDEQLWPWDLLSKYVRKVQCSALEEPGCVPGLPLSSHLTENSLQGLKQLNLKNGEDHRFWFVVWAAIEALSASQAHWSHASQWESENWMHIAESQKAKSFPPPSSFYRGQCQMGPTIQHKSSFNNRGNLTFNKNDSKFSSLLQKLFLLSEMLLFLVKK